MKVHELIERLSAMERDATVTVAFNRRTYRGMVQSETRINNVEQIGAGFNSVVRLDPEDDLELVMDFPGCQVGQTQPNQKPR